MNTTQKTAGLMSLSIMSVLGYYLYNQRFTKKYKQKMIMLNNWPFHDEVLRYICVKYGDDINSFNYSVDKIYHFNEWRFRRKEKPVDLKIYQPNECDMIIMYEDNPIHVKFNVVLDNNNVPYKIMSQHDCCMDEEIVTKLELRADSKQILTDFADEAKAWCDNEKKKINTCYIGQKWLGSSK